MKQCSRGSTASMLATVLEESAELEHSAPSSYRDSIQRISVSGGRCRSAGFSPQSDGSAAGEGRNSSWSSASPASASSGSAASYTSSRRCPLSFSSSDGGGAAASDGAQELHSIALQMFHDGYVEGLLRAFDGGLLSSECDGGSGLNELPLVRWFTELDVDWVLLLHTEEDGDVAQLRLQDRCVSLQNLIERWIRALLIMVRVLCFKQLELRAKRSTVRGVRKAIQYVVLLATKGTSAAAREAAEHELEVARFELFAEVSILRMLAFVDAVATAAAALNDHRVPETLPYMLQVYACVTDDSPNILALFKEGPDLPTSSGDQLQTDSTTSMFDAMYEIFLQKRKKLSVAIWSMMEKVRAYFLTDDWWQVMPVDGGVHRSNRLMMNYIMLLLRKHKDGALDFVFGELGCISPDHLQPELQENHFSVFLSETEGFSSVVNLIVDMISCLERRLVDTSYSISDPGLRCIFLMNNCSFIALKIQPLLLPSWTPIDVLSKIQRHVETYIDVSWEPVMSCLYHDMPRGFLRCGRALDKFESEFHRTYATQKLWKVPNPELRKRLRKNIIEKVISGYSKYMAERTAKGKNTRQPKNTPLELEQLLEELFEG